MSNTRGQSRTVKQWVQRSYGDWLIGVRGQMCVDQYWQLIKFDKIISTKNLINTRTFLGAGCYSLFWADIYKHLDGFSNTDQCLSLMSCFYCQLLSPLQYTLKYNILFSIVNNNTEILANHHWIISAWLYQDIQKFTQFIKSVSLDPVDAVVKNCLWKW